MASNKEILDKIVIFEASKVRNAFLRNGLDYWPAIRIRLAFGLIAQRYQNSISKDRIFKKGLISLCKNFCSILKKSPKSEVLFVTHDNYQYSVEGRNYDRVLEGYKLDCRHKGESYLELNLATGDITFCDSRKVVKRVQGHLFLLKIYVYILARLMKKKRTRLDKPVNYINKNLRRVFPGYEVTTLHISQYLIYIDHLVRFFDYLLKQLGVTKIYQATYYDPIGLSINAAASQLGIKTYCAQHGGQSRNNPAFGQWTNLPAKGYAMLPDIFLCWDKESTNTITEWSSKNKYHMAQTVGYKWAELWRYGKIQYSGTTELNQLAKGKLNILYSMQPSIGITPSIINKMVKRFYNEVNWWFRLHPRQIGSQVEQELRQIYYGTGNIFISEATDKPLPALMTVIDLHLTCFSSCVYEAMMFDVPTVFIDRAGQEYFNETIQSGKAELCLTFEELENNIYKRLHNASQESNNEIIL
jgi:hypothetical protein